MNAIDIDNIEEARQENDDPDHPDALSTGEYRDLLDDVQAHAEDDLDLWVGEARDQDELLGETEDAYYLADYSGHAWNLTMSDLDIEDDTGVVRDVLHDAHRRQAEDDGFAGRDVHVIAKPDA